MLPLSTEYLTGVLGGRLMLSANGLRLADNGLANSAPGSHLLTIDDSDLRMGQCPQPAMT
jgi:hypothetical protein